MKALIAMSGGVDSSVAAYLIKKQGIDTFGAMMLLNSSSIKDAEDAARVCEKIGIPFKTYDFSEQFNDLVVSNFVESYEAGETPNPCIECNKHLKFGLFLDTALSEGFDCIVTGHYAVIEQKNGRYLLKKADDITKDQSYVLYGLTQHQLSHVLLPLGSFSKSEIRETAADIGFENAGKSDSQDICFVPDGDYATVIKNITKKDYPEGDFVDTEGNILGRHKGIIRYTVGQRKGLGLALKAPMYVLDKNVKENTVILASNDELFKRELDVKNFNYILFENPQKPFRAKVRIRYNQKEQWATVLPTGTDTVHITFDEPQRAIAKGQSAVVYDGEYVIGGGIIT